jgi:hypothetical protein
VSTVKRLHSRSVVCVWVGTAPIVAPD